MKHENQERKVKSPKQLFVKELARDTGDQGKARSLIEAGPFTTLALGEEKGL